MENKTIGSRFSKKDRPFCKKDFQALNQRFCEKIFTFLNVKEDVSEAYWVIGDF